ncbi:hypothetical protein BGY98DRAFT_377633 [Russula aff. rugulosa BPL654]|nr:hypothetical protein BGY98DRAFT_377633 [Russula aff. rugulosa BPL654]
MSSWPELFTCSSPFIRRQGCRGHAQLLSAFLQCVKLMLTVPQLSFQNTQASAPDNCRIQHLLNLAMGVSPSNIMHNHRRLLCSDNIALKLASQLLHLHLSLLDYTCRRTRELNSQGHSTECYSSRPGWNTMRTRHHSRPGRHTTEFVASIHGHHPARYRAACLVEGIRTGIPVHAYHCRRI